MTTPAPQVELSWQVHPAKDRPWAAAVAIGVIVGFSYLVTEWMGQPWWGTLAAVVLLFPLRSFFYPTTWKLTSEAIVRRGLLSTQRMRWSDVRRFGCNNRGAYISTHARGSVLDAFRGLSVQFARDDDRVIEEILTRLPASATILRRDESSCVG